MLRHTPRSSATITPTATSTMIANRMNRNARGVISVKAYLEKKKVLVQRRTTMTWANSGANRVSGFSALLDCSISVVATNLPFTA
jgi:hypothetical protein